MTGYGIFAKYYDLLTENIDYRRRGEYFDRLIKTHGRELPKSPILLDLGCGTGSLTVIFADLGYDVIGVDGSEEMLTRAAGKSVGAGKKRPLFLCQTMEKLDLYGTVDVTISALDSLNHLRDEKALSEVFRRVSLFTNPGGLFIFDLNTAYKHRNLLSDNIYVYEPRGVYCVWKNSLGADDAVNIELDFFEENADKTYSKSSEHFREIIFTEEVIAEALEDSGFGLSAVYGDDTQNAPGDKTERLIYVAIKKL